MTRGETSKGKGFWDVMFICVGFVLKEAKNQGILCKLQTIMFWKDCLGKAHLPVVLEYYVLCAYVHTPSHLNSWHKQ